MYFRNIFTGCFIRLRGRLRTCLWMNAKMSTAAGMSPLSEKRPIDIPQGGIKRKVPRASPWGFIFLFIIFFQQPVGAQDDWQYWSEYNFSYKMTDRLSVILNPSIRIKSNVSENQYWESRQGLSYKLTDQWMANFHYLHSESKSANNKWVDENTFEFQPTYKWKFGGFDLANRLRLEYRIVNGAEKWRYRDQIKAGRKIKVFHQEIAPFVSNEFFYDESVDQFNQNRTRAGISRKMSKTVTANVFYQYKSNRVKKDWYGENIFGTGLDVVF